MSQLRAGLLGRDILASKSPMLHQSEAKAQGLELVYELFDFKLQGKDVNDISAFLNEVQLLNFSGLNITHPYKQAIIPFLDELSESAEMIGAVNTLTFKDRKIIGHNTDFMGFKEAFIAELGDAPRNKVLLLGAGGAGSAVAHAMLELNSRCLSIYDPDIAKAQRLTKSLQSRYGTERVQVIENSNEEIPQTDGLINASPLGMDKHPGMPVDKGLLKQGIWVADIIYFPIETELIKNAKKSGCRTMNGGRMVVSQAALSFKLFTGLNANNERMLENFTASYKKQ